ncbi:MAG: hypothetical protein DRR19_27315 [Candidatus Parabeggiatoa sp. nov. 1]|nr:MAG: hypothetical protein DRR19_27315 [Gammaproteobacteria bacterium]
MVDEVVSGGFGNFPEKYFKPKLWRFAKPLRFLFYQKNLNIIVSFKSMGTLKYSFLIYAYS